MEEELHDVLASRDAFHEHEAHIAHCRREVYALAARILSTEGDDVCNDTDLHVAMYCAGQMRVEDRPALLRLVAFVHFHRNMCEVAEYVDWEEWIRTL